MGGNTTQYFGRVKFYDHSKNHFGYVGDVFSEDGALGKDVYMREDQLLNDPEKYWDGRYVTFTVIKENNKYSGENIAFLDVSNPLIFDALDHSPDKIKRTLIEKIADNFEEIPQNQKSKLKTIASNLGGKESFELLMALDSNYFFEHLDQATNLLSDIQVLNQIKKIEDKEKLIQIANRWEGMFEKHDDLEFAKILMNNVVLLNETEGYSKYLFNDMNRIGNYLNAFHKVFYEKEGIRKTWNSFLDKSDRVKDIDGIHKLPSEVEGKHEVLNSFVDIFESKLKDITDKVKFLFIHRFDHPSVFANVVNHWRFEHLDKDGSPGNHSVDRDLLDVFEARDIHELDLDAFRSNLLKNIHIYGFKDQIRWGTILTDPEIIEVAINSQPVNTLSEIQTFLNNLSAFKKSEEYDLAQILKSSTLTHRETLQFLLGVRKLPSIDLINQFITDVGEGVQLYLLQYCSFLYSNNKLSLDEMKIALNQIDWTEMNVLITNMFIKKPNTDHDSMRVALNEIYKKNIANYSNEALRISKLVQTCDGRAKPRGNIEYNWSMKTYEFSGGFGMEKGDHGNSYNRNRYASDFWDMGGDSFCEGKFWKEQSFFNKNKNQLTQKKYPVFWCRGDTCWQPNNIVDEDLHYSSWGMPEILNALGLSIKQEFLAHFAGWANRMNEIVSRLSCRTCGLKILPEVFDAQTLGFYAVPIFKCMNQECAEYEIPVRLTHCINGFCKGDNNHIIDSRDCPQCAQNLLVCQDCFSCCGHHHDRKELCCPQCGGSTKRNEDAYTCNDCDYIITLDENAPIKRFWARDLSGRRVSRKPGTYR